jgi:hypothetical protein
MAMGGLDDKGVGSALFAELLDSSSIHLNVMKQFETLLLMGPNGRT